MENFGVSSVGIKCPIIREGDNIVEIVVNSVLENTWNPFKNEYILKDKDIIAVTESVVARSAGLYVTVDEIAEDIKKKFGESPEITLIAPIYSRNRFSMILKGIARAAKKVTILMPEFDEVGNPRGVNQFTGVNIQDYYTEICHSEDCHCMIMDYNEKEVGKWGDKWIYCGLHDYERWGRRPYLQKITCYTLADICADKNPDFGLLGTNKATEEKLKLFPTKELANRVCEEIKALIKEQTGIDVIVMIYGDGSYKDIDAGIWEMADPVSSPGYTDEGLLNSTPNEIKLKYFIDLGYTENVIQERINTKFTLSKNSMDSQGTTPRRFINLLASLADLTSGSGERATPVVWIHNYFA